VVSWQKVVIIGTTSPAPECARGGAPESGGGMTECAARARRCTSGPAACARGSTECCHDAVNLRRPTAKTPDLRAQLGTRCTAALLSGGIQRQPKLAELGRQSARLEQRMLPLSEPSAGSADGFGAACPQSAVSPFQRFRCKRPGSSWHATLGEPGQLLALSAARTLRPARCVAAAA
jgi:hypothetical protein